MELIEIEREVARLDAIIQPVAKQPVDIMAPDAFKNLGAQIAADLAELHIEQEAEAVLRTLIAAYEAGDETTRIAIRRLFDRYTSFRWAAHLPREWDTAEEFRAHLVHLSACDQGADPRDELLWLKALTDRARQLGIDVAPILAEVAAMSSEEDRYGMGSVRYILGGRASA